MNQVPSVEREPAAVELRRVKIVFAALYFFFIAGTGSVWPLYHALFRGKGPFPRTDRFDYRH